MPLTKINNRSLSGNLTSSQIAIAKTNLPAGSVIQTKSKFLKPGVDFSGDVATTSSSYVDLAGNVTGALLEVSLTDIQATSHLIFTYFAPMFSNGSNEALYNIYETVSGTYAANSTIYPGANATEVTVAGQWDNDVRGGGYGFTHIAEVGQFTGNCTFRVRIKNRGSSSGSGIYWHWWSNRTGQNFTVQEIAG